jgi:hypothetical protein
LAARFTAAGIRSSSIPRSRADESGVDRDSQNLTDAVSLDFDEIRPWSDRRRGVFSILR